MSELRVVTMIDLEEIDYLSAAPGTKACLQTGLNEAAGAALNLLLQRECQQPPCGRVALRMNRPVQSDQQ